ncbi:MAG: hypothetical protein A2Z71_05835 [Chloroflexi bacterium RBG_13_50_21]|nr:MAG: hypothetical protein A2Z71_05835 [Chloroflexi bacterium RBG_13_50_21]OGO65243.1 MAG: hypothetical protein A2029_14155 [Chloroflexi bacterium RBG_19FT_COMBO_47_9]
MYHNREEVIERTIREFELLDHLVANLTKDDWERRLLRPETKDPWTVKDALAHITHWKADIARSARGQRRPPEERGLNENDGNNLIYLRWRDRSPQEVLTWHRQVQEDVLAALRASPEEWFSARDRRQEWPYDLDGHSAYHRTKDIARALKTNTQGVQPDATKQAS